MRRTVFSILHLADSLADELLLVTYLIGGVRFGPRSGHFDARNERIARDATQRNATIAIRYDTIRDAILTCSQKLT